MGELLALAPDHWIGEAEARTGQLPHWAKCGGPAAKHRDMAPHQWSYTTVTLQGDAWRMLHASAKELQQGIVHTALPELPDCLCTAVSNFCAMQIQKVWSSTQAHTTCH